MKIQIIFSVDLDNGEADITRGSIQKIDHLPPLMKADVLQDILGITQKAYDDALVGLRVDWQKARENVGR